MKSIYIAAIAALGLGVAAPAFAQDQAAPTLQNPQLYVNLGYTYLNPYDRDVGEINGRMGLRLGRYWGVEGEIGSGVLGAHFSDGGARYSATEGLQTGGYVVGYLPLPAMGGKLNLLARVGYGETALNTISDPTLGTVPTTVNVVSWNYGAGVQYMLDHENGLRFDYTRRDFQATGVDDPKDVNSYTFSLVHRF